MDCSLDIELWKFNDIYFDEESHTYTDTKGTQYTSVTKFVDRFFPKKDWDAIAAKYAVKNNMPVADVKLLWDKNKNDAAGMGTQIHAYVENLWKRKNYAPAVTCGDYEIVKPHALEMYTVLSRRYVPIRNEFIVYNQAMALCGMIDFLCYDRVKDCLAILDWKTNKEIKRENRWQEGIGPLAGLPDCHLIRYSAQLSTYKLLIERTTTLRIDELALVHIRRDGWEVVPCMDLSAEIGSHSEEPLGL